MGEKKRDMKPRKDFPRSRHAAEEAARRAAEEEAERERLAQAAELARLASVARLAEEEARLKKANTALALGSEEDKRKDLVKWLKSVPLSESCFERVDRAFSNGVLVAELIHYFCPWMCDKSHYFKWSSSINKLSNWENLNRKVFPQLGFRLRQRHFCNILNPFSCGKHQKDCEKGLFIYKLLFRIRDKLAEQNPSVYDYRSSSVPPNWCEEIKPLRPPKKEFVNMLDNPSYSRVEMLLEAGFYDREEAKPKQPTQSTCQCYLNCQHIYEIDQKPAAFSSHSCATDHTFRHQNNDTEIYMASNFDLREPLIRTPTYYTC